MTDNWTDFWTYLGIIPEINRDKIRALLKGMNAYKYGGHTLLYLDRGDALRILGLDMPDYEKMTKNPEIMKVLGLTIFETIEDKGETIPRYRVSCLEDLLKVRQIVQEYFQEQEQKRQKRRMAALNKKAMNIEEKNK